MLRVGKAWEPWKKRGLWHNSSDSTSPIWVQTLHVHTVYSCGLPFLAVQVNKLTSPNFII